MSRTKCEYRSSSRDVYNAFCKEYPEVKIDYNKWKEVVYSFNESFRDYILETGNKARYPFGIGEFSINKKKRKRYKTDKNGREFVNMPVDWKRSKEAGKIVFNLNLHTDGYFFGWLWFKPTARFKFTNLWRFKPSRTSSRLIAHYIKSNKEYQHLYNTWKK